MKTVGFPTYNPANAQVSPNGTLMVAKGIRKALLTPWNPDYSALCRAGKVKTIQMPDFTYDVTLNGNRVTVTGSEIAAIQVTKYSKNWGNRSPHQSDVPAIFKDPGSDRVGNSKWGWFDSQADFKAQYVAQFKALMAKATVNDALTKHYNQ